MTPWLLGVTSCIYAWAAYSYYMSDRHGMAVAFLAYAISNIGFIWDAL